MARRNMERTLLKLRAGDGPKPSIDDTMERIFRQQVAAAEKKGDRR